MRANLKEHWKQIYLSLLFVFISTHTVFSQTGELGTWNILHVRYNLNDRLSLFGEGQLRSLKFYDNYHYYEYKGGVNFRLHQQLQISLGAGSYQTYREGGDFVLPKNNDEFRIWPQVIFFQSLGPLRIEHRYRAESRFTSNGYRNRFRYRLGLSYPFGKQKNGYQPFQVSTSNEVFFTNREPYFERNRFFLGAGYKPSSASSIQVGYLYQYDYQINDETGRDFFQITYMIELFRKSRTSSAVDLD
jgi:hypothetical protein